MEQITAMKIKGVTFTDFRNHKAPQSYTFGDISYITGHNRHRENHYGAWHLLCAVRRFLLRGTENRTADERKGCRNAGAA
ncbi:MAG: hypothetical protein ACLT1K_03110 [[Clostridium] leptum]